MSAVVSRSPIRLSIGNRVLLSNGFILLVFLLATLFGFTIAQRSMDSFYLHEQMSYEATLILEINNDISELQRYILNFNDSRSLVGVNSIARAFMKLEGDLATIRSSVDDGERRKKLESMSALVSTYERNIRDLEASQALKRRMINEVLPNQSDEIVAALDALQADIRNDHSLHDALSRTRENFLTARVYMSAYLVDRKFNDQKLVDEYLGRAVHELHEVRASGLIDARRMAAVDTLVKRLTDYRTSFSQAVQAVRGYYFLISVVMAGEAEEFRTLALEMKSTTLGLLTELRTSMQSDLNDARRTIIVVTLATTLLALVLSLLISRTISVPIKAISQTLGGFTEGRFEQAIPGLERMDEIGVLARSAAAFRDTSYRTRALLEQSQDLASELQAREQELQVKAGELEKSNEQLDSFAYVASHDLKSPLRAIDNLAGWIAEDAGEALPAPSQEHLAKLRQRVERMRALLDDLLTYSRVGTVSDRVRDVDLRELVDEVVLMTNHPEGFEFDLPECWPLIRCELIPLRHVLMNLVSNAVKYCDKDAGKVRVAWRRVDNGYIEVSVADNGPGIDPRFHEKIFQMFQTLNPRDVYEGSGMGLAIARKIVESQGGELGVASIPGDGAVFRFTWPCGMTEPAGPAEDSGVLDAVEGWQ